MKYSTILEIVAAIHKSPYVSHESKRRGGLWFVTSPGQLKSTALEELANQARYLLVSNLTVKSLDKMRPSFLSGDIRTLAISDLEQIYRRHTSVSSQIEGVFEHLVEEGYRNPGFTDQRIQAPAAKCTLIGGMTITFFEKMQEGWLDGGFYRRFLWSRFTLEESGCEVILDAIKHNKRAELNDGFKYSPLTSTIRPNLTEKEVNEIQDSLRFFPDVKTILPFAMKICSVLKWKFPASTRHMDIWRDFAPSLTPNGAILSIPNPSKKTKANGNPSASTIQLSTDRNSTPLQITQRQIRQQNAMK